MAKKVTPKDEEPVYKKWATIVSTIVALSSLILNVYLGISNTALARDKKTMEDKLNTLELEKRELDLQAKRQELGVDLETRYLVIGGSGLFEINQSGIGDVPIVQNQTLQQLDSWRDAWETEEKPITVKGNGAERSHGVVLLRVSNRGKQVAQRVILTMRWKDFPIEGSSDGDIWELETDTWQESSVALADLAPQQGIVVPLAHVLGTNMYFGRLLMPLQIKWFNPTLQKEESRPVAGMVPEDQWMAKGLNIRIAQ